MTQIKNVSVEQTSAGRRSERVRGVCFLPVNIINRGKAGEELINSRKKEVYPSSDGRMKSKI
jgi:hypothetical protein